MRYRRLSIRLVQHTASHRITVEGQVLDHNIVCILCILLLDSSTLVQGRDGGNTVEISQAFHAQLSYNQTFLRIHELFLSMQAYKTHKIIIDLAITRNPFDR